MKSNPISGEKNLGVNFFLVKKNVFSTHKSLDENFFLVKSIIFLGEKNFFLVKSTIFLCEKFFSSQFNNFFTVMLSPINSLCLFGPIQLLLISMTTALVLENEGAKKTGLIR